MSAILVLVQVTLAALPNIELVSLLVILYALHFGRKTLWAVYVFVLLEGVIYGFGMWWFSYLYVWAVLYLLARLLRKNRSLWFWAPLSALFGLGFGAMTSIPYFIAAGPAGGFAYFVAGIPFDALHCAGNFLAAALLFRPLDRLFADANRYFGREGVP